MDETEGASDETKRLRQALERLNAGDASVRGELLNITCQRLVRLTDRLRRELELELGTNETTEAPAEDLFHNASMRLYQAMFDVPIRDVRQFYRLAAFHIRRELIEICSGGTEIRWKSNQRLSLDQLSSWAHFHNTVESLPEAEREVFELVWYHELTRAETAHLLGVPLGEVRRLWREARLSLHDLLGDDGLSANSWQE